MFDTKKYKKWKPFDIITDLGGTLIEYEEIGPVYIMSVLLKGVEAGDTDYYLRHVDINQKMYNISDMLITSKTSE